MATPNIKLGQTIETRDSRQGIVRYIGELHIAQGEWLGLELADASGKNDGSVKGEHYFECKQNHGIFVRKESVIKVIRQPTVPSDSSTTAAGAVTSTRSRPGSVVSADVARKRQSLMSPASAVTAGSRLSLRSPTKSPVKASSAATSTTNTSAASTPRTSTPATTARTSDSSAKSRLSTASRQSIAPSTAATRTTTNASRPSLSASAQKPLRPSSISSRASLAAKRPTNPAKPVPRTPRPGAGQEPSTKTSVVTSQRGQSEDNGVDEGTDTDSQMIEEAEGNEQTSATENGVLDPVPSEAKAGGRVMRTNSISQSTTASTVEGRAAQVRELEQLRIKVRNLEKYRDEDQEKLQQHDSLQGENERYKNIIQALQNKLKGNQQEMAELRLKYEEVQSAANMEPERSAEQESELELATLDKEMAEERAETYHMELEALKTKHEELELELEILREENQELGSVMSPEERASAGWLQMARERERLREALVMLRDMSQQNEADLRTEIKELQESRDDAEVTAAKYADTAQTLARTEETNRHLMEQLEAIESNDEVVEAMEAQREQQMQNIEQLRRQIQELEEHIQVTDELENFHIDEEKRLHAQLDEAHASLYESNRQNVDQNRLIEDLEYTHNKFRDVVQGLQNDIDELRRSRDISATQANDMSSKSRAMMDLKLQAQSNTIKLQSKNIDSELDRVRADLSQKQVEILNLFTIESFEAERNPLLTMLCFRRLQAKANLVSRLLNERLRERAHLTSGDEIFNVFEVIERFQWIAGVCQRFDKYMSSCSIEEYASCGAALQDVEPVERVATGWLEALRRDELSTDGPDQIKRMQGVLNDLAEKLIIESSETKATEVLVQSQMVENYTDSAAGQITAVVEIFKSRLGDPVDEDEESLVFDKKMIQLTTKARMVRFLSGKVTQQLSELRTNSMCLNETSWVLFEDAEQQAEALVRLVRYVGTKVAIELFKDEPEQTMSYANMIDFMTTTLQEVQGQDGDANGSGHEDDAFGFLAAQLDSLQHIVDNLNAKSSDLNTAVEFESNISPWVLRSRYLKAQKTVPPETQEEIVRLERRGQELSSRLVDRERTIEEMNMRVELAERRMKDSRARDDKDKAHQEEVEKLESRHTELDQELTRLRSELEVYQQKAEQDRIELETLRMVTNGEVIPMPGTPGIVDDRSVKQVQLEANLLQAEINALQAAVRFYREENHNLRIPTTEVMISAAKTTWLKPTINTLGDHELKRNGTRQRRLEREAEDIYSNLIDVASSLKPVRLTSKRLQPKLDTKSTRPDAPVDVSTSSWQPRSETTRYAVLRQREEIERWDAWRSDFVSRAKLGTKSLRPKLAHRLSSKITGSRIPTEDGSNLSILPEMNGGPVKHGTTIAHDSKSQVVKAGAEDSLAGVQIVES